MKQLNRYYRRSRIAEKKFREIIKYFALDLTANKTAELTGLTHKTVNQIYLKIVSAWPKSHSDSHRSAVRSRLMKATSGPSV